MTTRIIETSELARLDWCDAQFFGYLWRENDLYINLSIASTEITEIRCHWASDLKTDLEWIRPSASTESNPIRVGGPLLTWDGSLEQDENGRWVLSLNFSFNGELKVECEKVTTVSHDPNSL